MLLSCLQTVVLLYDYIVCILLRITCARVGAIRARSDTVCVALLVTQLPLAAPHRRACT